MLLQLAVKNGLGQAQALHGRGAVAAALRQRLADDPLFLCFELLLQRHLHRLALQTDMLGIDDVCLRQGYGTLQHVFQFPDVSGLVVGRQAA